MRQTPDKPREDSNEVILTFFEMKITLKRIERPIWRTLFIPGDITLHKFHKVIQISMCWEDYHLYKFMIDNFSYSSPAREFSQFRDSQRIKLSEIISEKIQFDYVYDFENNWEHEIVVEEIYRAQQSDFFPICLGGERACPPEGIGIEGVLGYKEFLKAISKFDHKECQHMLFGVGVDFDPERFDPSLVNEKLKQLTRIIHEVRRESHRTCTF